MSINKMPSVPGKKGGGGLQGICLVFSSRRCFPILTNKHSWSFKTFVFKKNTKETKWVPDSQKSRKGSNWVNAERSEAHPVSTVSPGSITCPPPSIPIFNSILSRPPEAKQAQSKLWHLAWETPKHDLKSFDCSAPSSAKPARMQNIQIPRRIDIYGYKGRICSLSW